MMGGGNAVKRRDIEGPETTLWVPRMILCWSKWIGFANRRRTGSEGSRPQGGQSTN